MMLQSLLNAVSLPIIVIGTDRRIKYSNPAADIAFSQKQNECCYGEYCYRFLFGYDSECTNYGMECTLTSCRETGGTVRTEFQLDLQDDLPRFYEIFATSLYDENGTEIGIVEIFYDISDWKLFEKWLKAAQQDSDNLLKEHTTDLLEINKKLRQQVDERIRAEMALITAKKRSELLYRVIPSAIFTVDPERNITSWNDKAKAVTGYSRRDIIGQPCSIFALEPCTVKCSVFSKDIPKPMVGRECAIRTKDGRKRIISKNADYLLDDEGNIIGGVESFEDITDIKHVEKELSSERDKLMGIISAMEQGMHILSADFTFEFQNDVALHSFGDQVGGKCYQVYKELDAPCETCLMQEAIKSGIIQRTELAFSNGRHYELTYTPFRDVDGRKKVLILQRDVTEEKIMHAEAMRAAQLASVGKLAAGVAHEINNPINGIINYAQIIQDELGGNKMLSEISEKIIREGERVASIVSNLLSFARQYDEELHEVSIAEVVTTSVDLINHQLIKNSIILQIEPLEDLPPVHGHFQQLQQVFLNLFNNARYALNQRYSGKDKRKKIIISGEVVQRYRRDYVQITFKDMGTGIPRELVNKIFEPFFSSKTDGEGTGLGLSISKDIITKQNGYLEVDSEPGDYTAMIFGLPLYMPAEKKKSSLFGEQ
ncbi:MAG: PAS domain-containing protein [Desulfobulbaceae bacterium]|nr:PAS domain-containing protein [Desulfobulbaceae bacterium]